MKETITIALSKGRLFDEALVLLSKAGIEIADPDVNSRKLVIPDTQRRFQFFIVKPIDVPTYVEYGVADVGIAGRDVLVESAADIHQPLDLRIGCCKMVVAAPKAAARQDYKELSAVRIATKYPRITTEYFTQRGVPLEIIPLSGSVELAPLLGLSDRIVDLVSSGRTLAENGLEIVETILDISARLVVNRASYQIKREAITGLIKMLSKVVEQK
ncbi:MAG: ATP phosphoribosyltransferase [Acidobacteria bacterium]|nr:ATP phosphoribosyltransferase [Acidobacteriota bacterium]MCI0622882.1 ATP phosphoribosyltransferase [Acidobacteriota bacterium]MCI0720707.1 ATP phosphoribosyltransferase [Acidobacteriota bacterium]